MYFIFYQTINSLFIVGRAVKVLHEESLRLQPNNLFSSPSCKRKDVFTEFPPITPNSPPIKTCQNPVTLGGDVNFGPTYHAVHIRRGDFQYKNTRLPAEKVNFVFVIIV